MRDLQAILDDNIARDASHHAVELFQSLTHFVQGTGDVDKARELLNRVLANSRRVIEAPAVTGPHEYRPMSSRAADGLVIQQGDYPI